MGKTRRIGKINDQPRRGGGKRGKKGNNRKREHQSTSYRSSPYPPTSEKFGEGKGMAKCEKLSSLLKRGTVPVAQKAGAARVKAKRGAASCEEQSCIDYDHRRITLALEVGRITNQSTNPVRAVAL